MFDPPQRYQIIELEMRLILPVIALISNSEDAIWGNGNGANGREEDIRGQEVVRVIAWAGYIQAVAFGLATGHQADAAIRGDLTYPER